MHAYEIYARNTSVFHVSDYFQDMYTENLTCCMSKSVSRTSTHKGVGSRDRRWAMGLYFKIVIKVQEMRL